MLLMDFLKIALPDLTPDVTKFHLARYNGEEHPLDVYIHGYFDEWQSWQGKRNFSRPYVVSLIQAKNAQRWLYAGTFAVVGVEEKQQRALTWQSECYHYNLKRIEVSDDYSGRMYVQSNYKGRTSYLNGETLANELRIEEIAPVKLTFQDFPGYRNLVLTREQLELIIRHDMASWRTALENVKGIYLLTDTCNGKLYVGKASGAFGFWSRWSYYFTSIHGDNAALIEELGDATAEKLDGFRFSILEVMDPNATEPEVQERENHWKNILMSRVLGYNRN